MICPVSDLIATSDTSTRTSVASGLDSAAGGWVGFAGVVTVGCGVTSDSVLIVEGVEFF